MELSDSDKKLNVAAKQWVKVNKKALIAKFCDVTKFPTTENPVTIFMAGTPGAGKTEFSESLIEKFGGGFVRIDADEIREMMRIVGYNGANAELFQPATNKAVNILFDFANKKAGQNVVLDGTFAYGNWQENVQRSIDHKRKVEIYYLYQDPLIAWDYVEKRRKSKGRAVPIKAFIDAYGLSIENVKKAKSVYGDNVTVYFVKNNYTKEIESIEVDVSNIEELLPKRYNEKELRTLLNEKQAS